MRRRASLRFPNPLQAHGGTHGGRGGKARSRGDALSVTLFALVVTHISQLPLPSRNSWIPPACTGGGPIVRSQRWRTGCTIADSAGRLLGHMVPFAPPRRCTRTNITTHPSTNNIYNTLDMTVLAHDRRVAYSAAHPALIVEPGVCGTLLGVGSEF